MPRLSIAANTTAGIVLVNADTGRWRLVHKMQPPFEPRVSGDGRTLLVERPSNARACRSRIATMGDVTMLLAKWRQGDQRALDALVPLVYDELRRVAHARLRGERLGDALQTTALVHEAYLRLVDIKRLAFDSRTHFFAVAARLMRQILVDYARRQRADKRGGGAPMLTLDAAAPSHMPNVVDVLALDAALDDLAALEERLCRVVELRYFAGLTIAETATALDVSAVTVERDWAMAKAWLYKRFTMT